MEDFPEAPNVTYVMTASQLAKTLSGHGMTPEQLADVFTNLQLYEDPSIKIPMKPRGTKIPQDHLVPAPFEKKRVMALFYIPGVSKYRYIPLLISKSKIKGAGLGVTALAPIPKGAYGFYRGLKVSLNDYNPYYSWNIYPFSKVSGKPNIEKEALYGIDATIPSKANWTRYVNCGRHDADNNIVAVQKFDKVLYKALRRVAKGEELLVDYGEDYRVTNFGWKD